VGSADDTLAAVAAPAGAPAENLLYELTPAR
jgi:hypothetical protein